MKSAPVLKATFADRDRFTHPVPLGGASSMNTAINSTVSSARPPDITANILPNRSRQESETNLGQISLDRDLDKNANLSNYIADLEDLADQVYRYLDLEARAEEEAQPDLMARLQRITKSLKNIAVLYTNCMEEAFAQFAKTQRQVTGQLQQFPEAIADLQHRILRADQQIRQLSESVAIFSAAIDREIAFDPNLKNDAQRRARRSELMESDGDYIEAANALKSEQDKREMLLIELQLLHNQFAVLKLGMREAIALKEMSALDAA
jgi:hypothetical protein